MPERKRVTRAKREPVARDRARRAGGARRSTPARLLVVDVGNSETVVGVMEGREVRHAWRLTSSRMTADEAALRAGELLAAAGLAPESFRGAVVCSVAPALTPPWLEALARRSATPPLEVSAASVPHLAIRYHDRMSVGADRIANAIAARALYGTPAIVVDLGTATTFDCVSQQGAYLGGVIAPGMMTSAEELFRRAARIPRVELRRPVHALGRNTEEALQAGVIWGTAGQVDALVRRLALEMKGTPHVIATGGLASVIAAECETINRVDEWLTLKGMALIWEQSR